MKTILTCIFLFTVLGCFGQKQDSTIFTFVEQVPEYPGGKAAMMKFLQDSIKYPEKEREMGIQGTVYLGFIVRKDGSIDDVQVLKGVRGGSALDKEALRVVKMMPRWIPGKQNGKPVNAHFNLPIRFQLG